MYVCMFMCVCVYVQLYGLFKQAKYGRYDHPSNNGGNIPPAANRDTTTASPNDEEARARNAGIISKVNNVQLEAWKSYSHLSNEEAKKYFIVALFSIFPHWEYTGGDSNASNSGITSSTNSNANNSAHATNSSVESSGGEML